MLSPKAKTMAEKHLAELASEIAELTSFDFEKSDLGATYLEHLREHQAMWQKFLGLK